MESFNEGGNLKMDEQKFLEYANKAGRRIREINKLISGTSCPEDKSMLGDIKNCIYSMIQIYVAPIVRKEIESDDLNSVTTEIMFAEQDEIDNIIQGIMNPSHKG